MSQAALGTEPPPSTLPAANPLGRIALPEDVAEAICFLIDARHVNGVALRVDGGESVCVFP